MITDFGTRSPAVVPSLSLALEVRLLERVRDRTDATAWAEFVELYQPVLRAFVRQHGVREADIQDVVQETPSAATGLVRWRGSSTTRPGGGSGRGSGGSLATPPRTGFGSGRAEPARRPSGASTIRPGRQSPNPRTSGTGADSARFSIQSWRKCARQLSRRPGRVSRVKFCTDGRPTNWRANSASPRTRCT